MKAIWTILLLIASNVFMTFAWYGHLKLQEMKISTSWPLIIVILFSWGVAFLEYCAQETVLSKNLVKHHFQLDKDGYVTIPDLPGIGVELNMDVLNKYRR